MAVQTEPDARYRSNGRQERGFFISTESRPSFVTSEFWLTIIAATAFGIMAYASDALNERWGMAFAAAVVVAYVLSRGIAKAGSSDIRRDDDR